MAAQSKTLGDFSGLAKDYAKYRQGYADSVLTCILALLGRAPSAIDAVDLGAGTGIWSRMLSARGLHSVTAVEPNNDMRNEGVSFAGKNSVRWVAGSGENTSLDSQCADLVTAASSYHWMDYDKSTREIQRLLRPGGRFIALWNPRKIEESPMLVEIEGYLDALNPGMKRVSSGRSTFTDTLSERLSKTPGYDDLLYMEGRHAARQTPEEYIGAWRSVNDIQAQLGPEKWAKFIDMIEQRIAKVPYVETVFLTRAWSVRFDG